MTKEALKLALEALEVANSCVDGYYIPKGKTHLLEIEQAITAIKEALANEALEKMAENARELGLDYEPAQKPCGGCKGSGWVTRDPDIGTDQECFVCGGSGVYPKEPEPVAWRIRCTDPMRDWVLMYRHPKTEEQFSNMEIQPLYTTPPQRTWVGLTDEEIEYAFKTNSVMVDNGNAYMVAGLRAVNIARAIEAALKAKNT